MSLLSSPLVGDMPGTLLAELSRALGNLLKRHIWEEGVPGEEVSKYGNNSDELMF